MGTPFQLPFALVLLTAIPTFLFGAYYIYRANKISRYVALAFVTVLVYGMAVELLDIRVTHEYFYSKLLIMIGSWPNWMPVTIGVSWATIIFIAMQTSDRLGLPWYHRPFVDGMLAVVLDLVIDPISSASLWVAQRGDICAGMNTDALFGGVGVWVWCVPQADQAVWYTIPLANFSGWWMVVVAISFAIRFGRRAFKAEERPWWQQIAVLLLMALVAFGAVVGFGVLYHRLMTGLWSQRILLALLLFGPIALVALQARRLKFSHPTDWGMLAMPAFAYIGGLATFFLKGIDRDHWPGSAILLVVVALISATLFLLPYVKTITGRSPGGEGT